MPLRWSTPVVWPSWSLALTKPADHTLSSINIFQTRPLYTGFYHIVHCVWLKGCSGVWFDPLLCREPSLTNCSWEREDQHNVCKVQDFLGKKIHSRYLFKQCVLDSKTDTILRKKINKTWPYTLSSRALWSTWAPKGWGKSCLWTSWQLTASSLQTLRLQAQCLHHFWKWCGLHS